MKDMGLRLQSMRCSSCASYPTIKNTFYLFDNLMSLRNLQACSVVGTGVMQDTPPILAAYRKKVLITQSCTSASVISRNMGCMSLAKHTHHQISQAVQQSSSCK